MQRLFSNEKQERLGLIIQPGAVGDLILTLPLVRLLKDGCRLDRVDMIGHLERLRLLTGRSEVGRVLCQEECQLHRLFTDSGQFDPPEGDPLIELFSKYEWILTFLADEPGHFERNLIFTASITHAAEVISLANRPPAGDGRHAAEFLLAQFAGQADLAEPPAESLPPEPLIRIHPADRARAADLLAGRLVDSSRPLVAIHPGSGGLHKCWPREHFLKLAARLLDEHISIIFLLGPAERQRWSKDAVQSLEAVAPVLAELTLEDLAAVLACCDGYVGNDSGPSHLAGALGVATLTIFGPTDPGQWRPLGPKVRICRSAEPAGPANESWPSVDAVLAAARNLIG